MKIEIHRRKMRKSPNMWKLQDTLKPSIGQRWNDRYNYKISWVNENEDSAYQNILDTAKAVLRKFVVINAYFKKEKGCQIKI